MTYVYPVTASIRVPSRDLACNATAAVVRWGRDGVDDQPEASQLTVTLRDPSGVLADTVRPGDTVTARIRVDTLEEQPWYVGRVTDVELDRLERETTVRAAGPLAGLGRVFVGDTPWPAETDGQRIARILSVSGFAPSWLDAPTRYAPAPYWEFAGGSWLDAAGEQVTAGTVDLLPRDVDRQSAKDLLRDTAGAGGGVLYETRNGDIGYRDQRSRTATPAHHIDGCWLLGDATFTRTTEGLVNSATVTYGTPAGENDPRPSVSADDPDSIGRYGTYRRALDTQLATLEDAGALARRTVARRRYPRWVADTFRLDSAIAPAPITHAVLSWRLGETVAIAPIGEPAPANSLLRILEGATERLDGHRLEVDLAMSDVLLSVPASSWSDHAAADPSRTWTTVPAGVDWYAADDLLGEP